MLKHPNFSKRDLLPKIIIPSCLGGIVEIQEFHPALTPLRDKSRPPQGPQVRRLCKAISGTGATFYVP